MSNYLNNDNQTSLLFKKFQNKVQAAIDTTSNGTGGTSYFNEQKKSLTNIYNNTIFSNDVSQDLPSIYNLTILDNSDNILDSSWNTNNNVREQTISSFDIPNTDLRFYKKVYLEPAAGTDNAWYLIPPNVSTTTENNVLNNMIPYNFNPIDLTLFSPIVYYWNSNISDWSSQEQNQTDELNWLIDYESGILQFYQNKTTLNSLNIDYTKSTDEKKRPRISFIKYVGPTGINNSGGGGGGGSNGLLYVGDISNGIIENQLDVSAIYFDKTGFDVSLNNTSKIAIITNKSNTSSSDISYNFFNIPLAPTNGNGVLDENLNGGTIKISWNNPLNYQSALPFGKYLSYKNGESSESLVDIQRLPFHQHLHIEYLQFTAGIPDSSPFNNSSWTEITISNTSPGIQTILPNTLTEGYFTYGGNPIQTDLCGNITNPIVAPYERVYCDCLELGKGYQFRIYLDNSGTNVPVIDPIYQIEASWNYLYIPNISGDYIELGSFGPAPAPDGLQISNLNTNPFEFDISLSTTGFADASLNTPFPINQNLNLEYAFGVDISGIVDASNQQMPNVRYDTLYPSNYPLSRIDISSQFQRENKVILDYNTFNDDISACPQFKYTLYNLYGVNTVFPSDLSYSDLSFNIVLDKPSRDEAIPDSSSNYKNTLTSNEEINTSPITRINESGTISEDTAYPAFVQDQSQTLPIQVIFLEDNTSSQFDAEIINSRIEFVANNFDPINNELTGIDSSGNKLSYIELDISYTNFQSDSSNDPTIGYLQTINSNIDDSNFKLETISVEAGKTPNFQYQGYYTGLDISNLIIKNINLSDYPDICNNNYNSYRCKVKHYYNDPVNVSIDNWQTSGFYKYKDFNIGKRPELPITSTSTTYNNPNAILSNYLMGLGRPNPASSINIDYSYNLIDINNFWINSDFPNNPFNYNLTSDKLYYEYSSLNNPLVEVDSYNNPYPNDGVTSSLVIVPNLTIPSNFYYATSYKYSRAYDNGSQFTIKSDYLNNVTFDPKQFNLPLQDISFGINNQRLWWDFTWDSGPPTGTIASNNPGNNILPTGSTFIKAVGYTTFSSDTSYNHNIEITEKQLMWSNGSFKGVGYSSNKKNYPYIDFSSNYYNPNGELLDYSKYNTTGLSGESISINYSNNVVKRWWDDAGIPTPYSFTVNRIIKYITFNINMPYTQSISGVGSNYFFDINLNDGAINHDSSTTGSSNGYWIFHNEKSGSGINSTVFDGQKQYSSSGGNGSWVPFNNGFRINNPSSTTSSGSQTILQISVGLPYDLNSEINKIAVSFFKG